MEQQEENRLKKPCAEQQRPIERALTTTTKSFAKQRVCLWFSWAMRPPSTFFYHLRAQDGKILHTTVTLLFTWYKKERDPSWHRSKTI